MHKHNMDVMASLVILLLVTGAVASKHVDRPAAAAAAVASSSRTMAPMDYWRAVLPLTPMPQAIHDLLIHSTVHASQDGKGVAQGKNTDAIKNDQSQGEEYVKGPQKIGKGNEVEMKMQFSGAQFEEDKNILMLKGMGNNLNFYGTKAKEDLKKISTSYTSQIQKDPRKTIESYGYQGNEDNLRKITVSYESQGEGDLRTISTSYGSQGEDIRTISTTYGSQGDDLRKISTTYGSQGDDLRKISTSYGSQGEDDLRTISTSYGSQGEDIRTISTSYGSQGDDLRKISTSYESQGEHLRTISTSYGSQDKDITTISTSYGSQGEELRKIDTSYGSQKEDPLSMITIYDHKRGVSEKGEASKGYRHAHEHVHNHDNVNRLADVFFFQDVLRPGSVITPTIPVTTTLPSLLPRREADSLPFSTARLGDILAMFAPASLAMADEMRSTLESCEHPRPLPGEKAGCATSLESLAKLPAALLGTRNVRAFSGDMPVDPAGTAARRGRHNVTAVRKLSESPVAATCHDLTYPYAVFYCHTTKQVATYQVTLAAAEGGRAPAMEALAVCHLDTSQWTPRQPFLVAHNLKPGDVAVCHFLSKLSVIWVPAGDGEQGGAREAW
ncbi:hypothetical protein PVAP13_4KG135600 [Panicum virgatum]|uniref:BURP domain-containing protein n=1 Tax=Panicum virgatum TaxID=38727 RepID=A0A8T0TQP5_PANVG|nr:hypothetical protein PVAP13_4KG135600 [Panicum virgatum]